MKIAICVCQFYRRVPEASIGAIVSACRESGASCELVPDLCYLAAKDHDALRTLAACDVIFACQPRAVAAMFAELDAPRIVDLRTASLDTIAAALAVPVGTLENPAVQTPAVQNPAAESLEYAKLPNDWIPWFPVIDRGRCVHCKKCVDFCMFGVYSVESGMVRVAKPDGCKTDCPACARICPQNAIVFAKSNEDRLNGALDAPVKPTDADKLAFRERLKRRRTVPLFKEDEE